MIAANFTKSPKTNWEAQKAKLKMRFPKLTDEDLNFDEIHKTEMFNHLEPKLALTASELQLIIEAP